MDQSILISALIKIFAAFIGIFGSCIVGLLSYFLVRMVKKQEETNSVLIEGITDMKDRILSLEKDMEYIKKEHGRSLRPWMATSKKRKAL